MFNRPLRRGLDRAVLSPALAEQLTQAEQFQQAGQPAQAAALFAQMAEEATAQGHPRQAGNLHAQAAHAWVNAGNGEQALLHARRALAIFTRMGMLQRAEQFKMRFYTHLRERKMLSEATTFEQEAKVSATALAPMAATRGQLPSTCPQCGAPVRSDNVDWIDAQSAECDFCGAVIHTI